MKKFFRLLFGLSIVLSSTAYASEGAVSLKSVELDRDNAILQQGAHTVFQVCMRCHSLKYIKYQQLTEIGFTQAQVDKLRGNRATNETLKKSMPDSAAQFHFGKLPPDLSLMGKARKGGPDYIYTLLTSFYETPEGDVDNHLFPGIRMPDILSYSVYDQPDERAELENKAQAVARFLEWTADPKAPLRRKMGLYVVGYFILISILLYIIKRRIWKPIH